MDKILEQMNYTMDEFIDLCILLGCDYCDTIKVIVDRGTIGRGKMLSLQIGGQVWLSLIEIGPIHLLNHFKYRALNCKISETR